MVKKPLLVGVVVLSVMAITGTAYADSVAPQASSSNFLRAVSASPVDVSQDSAVSGSRSDLGLRTMSVHKGLTLTPASSKDSVNVKLLSRGPGFQTNTGGGGNDDCNGEDGIRDGGVRINDDDDDGPCQPKPTQVVPEPFSLILLGTGLTGLAAALRRRIKGSGN